MRTAMSDPYGVCPLTKVTCPIYGGGGGGTCNCPVNRRPRLACYMDGSNKTEINPITGEHTSVSDQRFVEIAQEMLSRGSERRG